MANKVHARVVVAVVERRGAHVVHQGATKHKALLLSRDARQTLCVESTPAALCVRESWSNRAT